MYSGVGIVYDTLCCRFDRVVNREVCWKGASCELLLQTAIFYRMVSSAQVLELCKLRPANLLEGFGVSAVFVPQLQIMLIVDFNEI